MVGEFAMHVEISRPVAFTRGRCTIVSKLGCGAIYKTQGISTLALGQ